MAGVVWLVQPAPELARAMRSAGLKVVVVGTGQGVDLDLGPGMDLGLALESCPWALRPALAVRTCEPPPGWEGLPCWLAVAPGVPKRLGEEVELGHSPREAAKLAVQLCTSKRVFTWLKRVHVNLPVMELVGRYRQLVAEVEVGLELGLDARALDELGPLALEELGRLLGNRPRSVHLPFMDLCPASTDPLVAGASRQRLETAARWAAGLGAIQAVAHLGYLPAIHRDTEDFIARFAQAMSPVARVLASAGVGLVLENTFEPNPQVWTRAREALAEASGVEVGLCLDVGHANCFSISPLRQWWEAGAHYIRELHLHDNDGGFDQHLPPGQGMIDWGWLWQVIKERREEILLTLEPHTEAHLWATLRALEVLWPEEEGELAAN